MLIFCYFFHCCLFTSLLFRFLPLSGDFRLPVSSFFLLPLPQVVAGVSQGICCRLPLPLPFALAFSFFCLFVLFCFN